MRKTALAFMAHPDDAEILCGGTLVRLADQGWNIHIATVASGDLGSTEHNSFAISHIRTEEAAQSARLIKGTYHCLGESDCFIAYDKPTIRKTIELFRRVSPTLVFTHAAKDYMMDHEIVSILARNGSFIFAAPNVSDRPLTADVGIPHLYYCDPVEAIDPYGNEVTPTTFIDVSAQMEQKLEMLSCHASQREWLRAHHGMDEYLDATRRHSNKRGLQAGTTYAEAFIQHRGHAYPSNDLLKEIL